MAENKGRHSASTDENSRYQTHNPQDASGQFAQIGNRSRGHFQGSPGNQGAYHEGIDPSHKHQYRAKKRPVNYVDFETGESLRKRKPVKTIIVGVAVLVLVGLMVFGGYKLLQSFGMFGSTDQGGKAVSVFIPEGSSTSEIAKALKSKGVITSEATFVTTVQGRGVEQELQPGQYQLKTGMADDDVIDALVLGPNAANGNRLTIPEGLTLEQTAAVVETACGIPAQDFIDEAHKADKYVADYPFLVDVYNNSLEGFLFPKTYSIPQGSNAEYVIRVLLNQFVKETASIDMSYAEERNLNVFDVVVLASLIEKETADPDEKPLVSSVLYNRLHEGWKLQICSTVIYAMGVENYDGHPLLDSDLEVESPYNTYIYESLPAGPICSPQLSSIMAAANPAQTDYFYYVLTSKDGTHTFCTNDEEFAVANEKYHKLFNVPN